MPKNEKYIIDKQVVYKEAEDSIYILDVDGNKLRSLNDVASLIWKMLVTSRTVDELVSEIVKTYDVSPTVARKDCSEFLSMYLDLGFLAKL